MDSLYHFCFLLLAQTQNLPTGGAAGAPAAGGGAGKEALAEPGFLGLPWYFLPAMLAVMVVYMLMSAPSQSAAAKDKTELLATLKKNDRVLTAGGILGTVVSYGNESEYVTLRVDESSNTRMQVLASSIVRVVSDEDKKEV
jgi:preprotein translocase subunit YajC